MTKRNQLFVAAGTLVWALSGTLVMAAENPPIADTSNETVLTLHESAETTLPADLLVVTLRAEANGSDPAKVQHAINEAIGKALARAKATPDVKASTGGYFVADASGQPTDHAVARTPDWRATQSVELVSKKFDTLLQLTGDLQQDGLLMSGMTFDLSPESRKSVHDQLVNEALATLRQEAATAATAMGMDVAGYKTLHLGQTVRPAAFRGFMANSAMKTAAIPPSAEPAAQPVRIDVDAEVRLLPHGGGAVGK